MQARNKYIVLAVSVVVGLIGLMIVLQLAGSGKLVITAPDQTPNGGRVDVTITKEAGGKDTFKLSPGESRSVSLHKGRVMVQGESGNLKSIDVVAIRGWGASTRVTTPVGEQHQIQKLASSSEECALVVGVSEFSAPCGSGGPVYRHLPVSRSLLSPKETIFGGASFGYTQIYNQGFLGFVQSTGKIIFIQPAKNKVRVLELPTDIAAQASRDQPLLVAADDQPSPYFAIVLKKINKIYLFKSFDSTSIVEIKLPKDVRLSDLKKVYDYQIVGDQFMLLAANSEHYEGEAGTNPKEISKETSDYYKNLSKIPQHIYEYKLSGEQTTDLVLPGGVAATVGFEKLAGGFYAFHTNFNVGIYRTDGEDLKPVFSLLNVTDVLPLKDKTYFVVDGTIYEFQAGEAGLFKLRSVFSSPALRISDLAHEADGIVFTALSNRGAGTVLDMFKMLGVRQTTPPFEEQVPYASLSRLITGYDYDDKTVVFYLGVGGSAGPSYDDLLRGMKEQLKKLKLDVGGRTVELGALN